MTTRTIQVGERDIWQTELDGGQVPTVTDERRVGL